ncbi:MAG TPA: hypothetical protein VGC62_26990 [Pseudomonas sp.]|uniref:hypothetical protein n=1 Tax=Pseudomonas sp. TaxID=306 RepID=UPI002ED8822A
MALRCAQNLREFRKDSLKHYSADIVYELERAGESFKVQQQAGSLDQLRRCPGR